VLRIIDGDREIRVSGRVADMIRWLVRNVERISRGNVSVRFACAADDIKYELTETGKA